MYKYLLILLIILIFPASCYAYTDDEYLQRAGKLGFFGDISIDKPLSRTEALDLLMHTIDFNKYQGKYESHAFIDVSEKDECYSNLQTAFEHGIILPQDYANNYFNPEAVITNYEFLNMLERVYKLHTGIDEFDFNQTPCSNQFELERSFKHLSKRRAVISLLKLVDSIYYNAKDPISIISPVHGTNYSGSINIQIESFIPTYFTKIDLCINGNVAATQNEFENFNLDISKYSPGIYKLKLRGYTLDGIALESIPIAVRFNNVKTQEPFMLEISSETTSQRTPNTPSDILRKKILLANYESVSNKIDTRTESDRILFMSNSPEYLKDATGNILFDSDVQKNNFRLLAYHVNDASVQLDVYVKVEIENLGIQPLKLSEHGGLGTNLSGSIAGYNSTYNYFDSYSTTSPTCYTRVRQYSIPAYSKTTLVTAYVKKGYIVSYIGDFNFENEGFYKVRVYYTPSNADDILSDPDGKHIRGVFPADDASISVDKPDTCFQLGADKKNDSSEANITNQTFGISENGFIVNNGHFGEVYSINIPNKQKDKLLIAVEFRGTLEKYPSFFVAQNSNGKVKGYGVNSEYSLYWGKQLIIDRINQSDYNFKFTIPAGMNGPVYFYVMKDT